MKLIPNSFFDYGLFQEVNLNNFFKNRRNPIFGNKPQEMQDALDIIHGTGFFTYGGYGENRKQMWEGTYIEKSKKYYHLGIDINVPAGTPIKCPFDCKVVECHIDTDTYIGWGGRLILESFNSNYLLVLAHLEPLTMFIPIGDNQFVPKDKILGAVGNWPRNGNVFQHLHIQAIKKDLNLFLLDGYGFKKDLKDNPNPFEIEW